MNIQPRGTCRFKSKIGYVCGSCRTATLDFFSDLAESKVAVFLFSILTSDGVPFFWGGKTRFLDNPTIQTSSCVLHTQPKL